MSQITIPDDARQLMQSYITNLGVPEAVLVKQYTEAYRKSASLADQFPSFAPDQIEVRRRKLAIDHLRLFNRDLAPLTDQTIIYLSHNGIQIGRSGDPYSNLYAVAKIGDAMRIVRMNAKGDKVEVFRELAPFTRYKVKVGRREGADMFFIDNRFTKDQGTPTPMSVEQLNKTFNIPKITVAEATNNPSRTQSDGWVIDTDWRCIVGYLFRSTTFSMKQNPNITRGVVSIVDDPEDIPATSYDAEGNPINVGMTGWSAPEHLIYERNSYCAFYGPVKVDVNKDTKVKTPSMSVYMILPIVAQILGAS